MAVATAALSGGSGCTSQTYGGHNYLFCTNDKSWDNARTDCQNAGMDLARIDSDGENEFVRSHLKLLSNAWIGGNDKTLEGRWVWSSDSTQFWSGTWIGGCVGGLYNNWGLLQPDDLLGQDCGRLAQLDGHWTDESCGQVADYVCEQVAPAPPPPPAPPADTACWNAAGLQQSAQWPMRGLCPLHRGGSKFIGSQVNTVNWTYSTGGAVRSSAAVSADGTIYAGSDDFYVYAIKPDGSLKWRYKTGNKVRSSPALGATGALYVGSEDNYVYALDLVTGALRWKTNTSGTVDSSPAIGTDGTVYVGSHSSYLYALNPSTGAVVWSYQAGGPIDSSPVIDTEGAVYFGSDNHFLYALKPTPGLTPAQRLLWKVDLGSDINSSPAIGPSPDHFIYVRTQAGKVYKLAPADGHTIASYTGPSDLDTESSPAIGLDGSVYAGIAHNVYAFKADLTVKWSKQLSNDVKSSPAVGADGTVYIGADDQRVYALKPTDGSVIWQQQSNGLLAYFRGSPAIGTSGAIYIGSDDKKIYSIGSFVCDATHKCGNGMGPCTADTGCVTGLVCGKDIGAKFGLPSDFDVCWDRSGCLGASSPDCGGYRNKCGTCDPGCSATDGLAADAPWPMQGQCPQQRGNGALTLSETPTVLWTLNIPGGTKAEPVIAADGTAYFGAENGTFYAVNRDATIRWSIATGNKIVAGAALGARGDVYFGSLDGHLYAANASTGLLSWTFTGLGAISTAPLVGRDGTIYVADTQKLQAVEPVHGALKWSMTPGGSVVGAIAMSNDGTTLYFVTTTRAVQAVSADLGTVLWFSFLENDPTGGMYMMPTGDLIAMGGNLMYQYSPDGKLVGGIISPDSTPWQCVRFGREGSMITVTRSNLYYRFFDLGVIWTRPATYQFCPVITQNGMWTPDNVNRVCRVRETDGADQLCFNFPDTMQTPLSVDELGMTVGTPLSVHRAGQCNTNADCPAPKQCQDHKCVACAPNCSGKTCGDADGCGGHCGHCGDGDLCQANADCNAGLQCVLAPDNVHRCACVPSCSSKHCGDSADDGCGGTCTGFCNPLDKDCHADADCQAGYVCGAEAGQYYSSPGKSACWPAFCPDFVQGRTQCGANAACGTCPVCVPYCAGRDCGDNGCGGTCPGCSSGGTCTGSLAMGLCEESQYDAPFYPADMPPPAPQGGGHFVDASLRGNNIGRVEGVGGVSEQGTATYRIPIEVPPGRAGFEPRLSLSYDSARGDGYLGRGWGLDGFPLSAISRCSRGTSLGDPDKPDTWRGAVHFDSNDRFCLDGQLLIATSGAYGADKTEYRTEVESFRKIVSYGGSTNPYTGPAYFQVWTKDGMIFTYGADNANDSSNVLLDLDGSIRRAWATNQVTDRAGSIMTVDYDNLHCDPDNNRAPHCGTRELLPRRISYGANDRHIDFVYDKKRPDHVDGFQNGAPISKTHALEQIQTFADSVFIRAYRISYVEPSEDPQQARAQRAAYYSIVKTVEDCAPTNPGADTDDIACKPPTVFRYGAPRGMLVGPTRAASYSEVTSALVLDFDGDGVDDLLYAASNTNTVHILLGTKHSTTDPFFGERDTGERVFIDGCTPLGSLDFDGDSLDDIAVRCASYSAVGAGVFIWLSNGTGFRGVVSTNIPSAARMADIDGDGSTDFLSSSSDTWSLVQRDACMSAIQRTPPPFPSNSGTWPQPIARCTFDNGFLGGDLGPCLGNPLVDRDGNGIPDVECNSNPNDQRARVAIDLNGDGLQDFVILAKGGDNDRRKLTAALNNGHGLNPEYVILDSDTQNPTAEDFDQAIVVDYDGDGREDLLLPAPMVFAGHPVNYLVWSTNPDAHSFRSGVALDNATVGINDRAWPGDFNGDGVTDLLRSVAGGFKVYWNPNALNGALRVVRDGFGNLSEFDYVAPDFDSTLPPSSLTDYVAGTDCVWPVRCNRKPNVALVRLLSTYTGALPLTSSDPFGFSLTAGQTQIETSTRYAYHEGRTYALRDRWLGYAERVVESIDPSSPNVLTKQTTQYDGSLISDGPVPLLLTGTPKVVITDTTVEGSELNQNRPISYHTTVTRTWDSMNSSSSRPFAYLRDSSTTREASDGVSTSTVTLSSMSRIVDAWGNVTFEQVSRADGSSDYATIEYRTADTARWQIGLPSQWDVTSNVPAATDPLEHHVVGYDYYDNGVLKTITQEPNFLGTGLEDDLYLKTTLGRDPAHFNVVETIEQTNAQDERVRMTTLGYDSHFIFPRTQTLWTGKDVDLVTSLLYDDGHGGLLTMVDPNGIPTKWSYDGFGRLRALISSSGNTTVFDLEPPDPLSAFPDVSVAPVYQVAQRESDGSLVVVQYDSAGNARRIHRRGFNDTGVDEELDYDVRGRVTARSRPHLAGDTTQGVAHFTYDNADRLITATAPDNTKVQHMYSPAGLAVAPHDGFATDEAQELHAVLDQVAGFKVDVMDARGLRAARFELHGTETSPGAPTGFASTHYGNGPFGQIQEIIDSNGSQRSATYDSLGRLQTRTDPDVGVHHYQYYPTGELRQHDSANGTDSYLYDPLGRVTERDDNEGITTWEYDGPVAQAQLGRLISSTSPNAPGVDPVVTTYQYEPVSGLLHGIVRHIEGQDFAVGIQYSSIGQISRLTYPTAANQGFEVNYEYDVSGALKRVRGAAQADTFWQLRSTDQGIRPTVEMLGTNGLSDHTSYEPLTGRISSIAEGLQSDPTNTSTFSPNKTINYTYFDDGNVHTRKVDKGSIIPRVTDTYQYDPLSRLKHVDRAIGTSSARALEDFDYELDGRIRSAGQAADPSGGTLTTVTYGYNQIPHAASSVGTNSYGYDGNGNQISRQGPDVSGGSQTIEYSPFDMPRLITTGAASDETRIQYDADQNRVLKRSDQGTTIYIDDLYQRIKQSSDAEGTAKHIYRIYAGGRAVAEVERHEHQVVSGTQISHVVDPSTDVTRYIHPDRIGSPHLVTDGSGAVLDEPEYSAFGDQLVGTSSISGYTGHQFDADVGLVDMGGRIYDPKMRQFITADPFVSRPYATQGLNAYAYVENNPVNWIDPSGFDARECDPNDPRCSGGDGGGGDGGGGGEVDPCAVWPELCEDDPPQTHHSCDAPGLAPGQEIPSGIVCPGQGNRQVGTSGRSRTTDADGSKTQQDRDDIDPLRREHDRTTADGLQGKSLLGAASHFSDAWNPSSHPWSDDTVPNIAPPNGQPLRLIDYLRGWDEFANAVNSVTDSHDHRFGQSVIPVSFRLPGSVELIRMGVVTAIVTVITRSPIAGRLAGAVKTAAGKAGARAYSVAFRTAIPKVGAGTRTAHFKAANDALQEVMKANPEFAKMIEQLGIKVPSTGKSPSGWTWHHVPDEPGVLELVPTEQHQGSFWQWLFHPGGKGGFKLWGGDY